MWADEDWRNLSQGAQHLYLLLLTHSTLNYAGVAEWRPRRLAAMTAGKTADDIKHDAAELAAGLFIVVDEETEEVLVRSFVKHDGLMKQPRLVVSMTLAFASVASSRIRQVIAFEVQKLREKQPDLRAWDVAQAQTVLAFSGRSAAEFALGFAHGFTPNVDQDLGLRTTTATATKNKSSSSEVADATPRPEVLELLDLLDAEIERNGGKKPSRTKKNVDAARLLLDRDQHTVEQVAAAIRWAQGDEFWRSNILSMSKLREKYDQLRLAAKRKPGVPTPTAVKQPPAVTVDESRRRREEAAERARLATPDFLKGAAHVA
ncbi:hypothetical protein HII28_02085 [Planctomonas sp. JC2975]|uniref:hypothetical protein n=1 Tax=Planctomonas sp. JC2975 TaxID=2729626 RepID=UPI0014727527|nr:hypothetical protein [Planctomonas sp. JC2975]NNC10676.1 hypothetical protein [Planctomonas sp. JC2975]